MAEKIYYHKGKRVEFYALPLPIQNKIVSLQNNNLKKDGRKQEFTEPAGESTGEPIIIGSEPTGGSKNRKSKPKSEISESNEPERAESNEQ
jgi:hypothetical protein